MHQPAAQCHQPQRVLEADDAGETGGDVFADAVAEHGGRDDAPRQPQPRQRVLDDEQRGLRRPRLAQERAAVGAVGKHQRAQIVTVQVVREQVGAAIDLGAERRLRVRRARAPMLTYCAPCPGNRNTTRRSAAGVSSCGPDAPFDNASDGVVAAAADNRATVRVRGPAGLERERDIGEVAGRCRGQVVAQEIGGGVERRRRLRRQRQDLPFTRGAVAIDDGRFFEHDVGVGAADAERADPGPARRRPRRSSRGSVVLT